jgi:hypothetical protein
VGKNIAINFMIYVSSQLVSARQLWYWDGFTYGACTTETGNSYKILVLKFDGY